MLHLNSGFFQGEHLFIYRTAWAGGCQVKYGVEWVLLRIMVKMILRDKEFQVKPGMTLLSSLEKCGILPESVIATREGELILEDEILKDGDFIKLVAVISGG
jgi:sulfur carrier protein